MLSLVRRIQREMNALGIRAEKGRLVKEVWKMPRSRVNGAPDLNVGNVVVCFQITASSS